MNFLRNLNLENVHYSVIVCSSISGTVLGAMKKDNINLTETIYSGTIGFMVGAVFGILSPVLVPVMGISSVVYLLNK